MLFIDVGLLSSSENNSIKRIMTEPIVMNKDENDVDGESKQGNTWSKDTYTTVYNIHRNCSRETPAPP